MTIFAEVNLLSESEIVSAAGLQKALDGKSYVCPGCGRGSRRERPDGIKQKTRNGRLNWWCAHCGENWSNVDVIAASYGIPTTNTAELAKKLEELFPKMKSAEFLSFGEDTVLKTKITGGRKSFAKMYKEQQRALPNFLATVGGKWRGLTNETLKDACAGYNVKYHSITLPYDDESYFWRAVEGKRRGVNSGCKRRLYKTAQIKVGVGKVNFLTEGEIDALSVYQVLRAYLDQFGIVATGSASFVRMTIEELNKTYGTCAEKPRFIWLGDNDPPNKDGESRGRKAAKEFVDGLNAAGYPTVAVFFASDNGRKIDANQYLQERGDAELFGFLIDAVTDTEKALDDKAQEIAQSKAEEMAKSAGIKFFSLSDYFSEKVFDDDVKRMAKYSSRKTGFDNLDAAQIFLPGLYILGGQPGAGKTTFAWQLLNQLVAGDKSEYCVFCSYEMSILELASKSIACEMRRSRQNKEEGLFYSGATIRLGNGQHAPEFQSARQKVLETQRKLKVLELSNTSLEKLIDVLKAEAQVAGNKPFTCAVDYLQLIPVENSKATAKERVDEVLLKLKEFQRETEATLILVSSLNRNSCQMGGKELFSFKESGNIEYTADVVWVLSYENEEDAKGYPRRVQLKCLKNRNGAICDVAFDYYADSDYFCEADKSDDSKKQKKKSSNKDS